ncbi:hypothetical protein V8G54_024772 [Vigna mungo]|uniref:Uncharacterized protein n=1 Tax=Vigna mungo TaxID=3915 RepID=A0AAQ3N7S4_VIGMU
MFSSLRRCHNDAPYSSRKKHELTMTQVVEHIQNPPNHWDYDKLRPFLFEASHLLPLVTLRLKSIPKALHFINYLRSITEHHQALSCVFEDALELATQHLNSQKELVRLHSYQKFNCDNIALTFRSVFLLLKCLGRSKWWTIRFFCSKSSTLLPKVLEFATNCLRGCLNRVALMMPST